MTQGALVTFTPIWPDGSWGHPALWNWNPALAYSSSRRCPPLFSLLLELWFPGVTESLLWQSAQDDWHRDSHQMCVWQSGLPAERGGCRSITRDTGGGGNRCHPLRGGDAWPQGAGMSTGGLCKGINPASLQRQERLSQVDGHRVVIADDLT